MVTCIGAFEAFCSREEWQAGKQDGIYRAFFKTVHDLLEPAGRFYMQTMVFGKNMIDKDEVDIRAAGKIQYASISARSSAISSLTGTILFSR